jgi:hypothetical protein
MGPNWDDNPGFHNFPAYPGTDPTPEELAAYNAAVFKLYAEYADGLDNWNPNWHYEILTNRHPAGELVKLAAERRAKDVDSEERIRAVHEQAAAHRARIRAELAPVLTSMRERRQRRLKESLVARNRQAEHREAKARELRTGDVFTTPWAPKGLTVTVDYVTWGKFTNPVGWTHDVIHVTGVDSNGREIVRGCTQPLDGPVWIVREAPRYGNTFGVL